MISDSLLSRLEYYITLHAEVPGFIDDLRASARRGIELGINDEEHQLLFAIYDATYTRGFAGAAPPHVPEEWIETDAMKLYHEENAHRKENACQHVAEVFGTGKRGRKQYRRWLDEFVSSLPDDQPYIPAPFILTSTSLPS